MVTVSTSNSKHIHAKLTDTQKAACRTKLVKLTNAITTAQDAYHEEACAIAKDNGRSLKWTRKQLYTSRGVFNRRSANPWNAFVKQKLDEENKGRAPGERLKLPAFIKAHSSELTSTYLHLSSADKNRLRENVNTYRQSRMKVTRVNPKTLQKDVNATFKTMQTEWAGIQARTGLEGMYIAVRGDVEQYHEPKLFYTAKVGSFIKDVLGMEPKRFALKVESWVAYNKHNLLNFCVDSGGTVNRRVSLTKLISLCRQLIQDGLDIVLPTLKHPPKKKVQMNYDNYEGKIVETYSVALENFPGTLANDKLVARIAKNKERQAHGEQIYKARKRQEKASIAKSAEMVEDTDEDSASSSEDEVDSLEA
ncbi:hypothetical protein P692DRAFT_20745511 [Suillus brevipes Sb2]|nr:hypothetical protein P692DRAFT_20745511 [Suillus brevipes Sb2]